ncbi:MAG: hypothetical protein AMXMBFR42_16870 [Burkholderiales bacterium]
MTDNSKPKDEAAKPATTRVSPTPASKDDLLTMPLKEFARRAAEEMAANLRQQTAESVQKPASKDDLLTMPLKDFMDRAAGEIAANLRQRTSTTAASDESRRMATISVWDSLNRRRECEIAWNDESGTIELIRAIGHSGEIVGRAKDSLWLRINNDAKTKARAMLSLFPDDPEVVKWSTDKMTKAEQDTRSPFMIALWVLFAWSIAGAIFGSR